MKFWQRSSFALGLFLLASSPVFAASFPAPTPAPTVAAPQSLPSHIPQYQVLQGCFHNTNGNCPAPSSNGAISDYNDLATALDYDETDVRAINLAHQAGIKTLVYTDPVYIHGGTTYNGVTYCPQGSNPMPAYTLMHERSYGAAIMNPNANQSTCGGAVTATVFGDIANPAAWQFWDQAILQNFAYSTVNNSGVINSIRTGLDWVRIDDMYANFNSALLCASTGVLSATGTFTTCGQSSPSIAGGTYTVTADNVPFPGQPAPNYAGTAYNNGVKGFFRSFGQYGLAVDPNDVTDPTIVAQIASDADHANIGEVTCENCITIGSGNALWNDTIWRNHVDMAIYAQSIGLPVHFFHPILNSQANEKYLYGSIWLALMTPKGISVTNQLGGSLSAPSSGVAISPLSYIIPTQPIADPVNMFANPLDLRYNPANPPSSYFAGALKVATGIYKREFAVCYDNHTGTPVSLGPCAAIVATPAAASSTNISALGLAGTYTHTVSWTGTGILTQAAYGDTYSLSETTAAPSTISQGTAVLLFT